MDKHFQLSIKSDTTEINVNSIDSEEVARIVQLAGLPTSKEMTPSAPMVPPAAPAPAPIDMAAPIVTDDQTCSICGGHDHTEVTCPSGAGGIKMDPALGEGQADHDYGRTVFDDDGIEVGDDHIWKAPKLPQRIVHQGDNPLISEVHSKLVEDYARYLEETSRENEAGLLSPLSDPDRPEFDADPFANIPPVDDGTMSPMSKIKRQPVLGK